MHMHNSQFLCFLTEEMRYHIGHTEHNLASFKKLAFFAFFFEKNLFFFLKNPYLCRLKSIFCEEELFNTLLNNN